MTCDNASNGRAHKDALARCYEVLKQSSTSFNLASRLLPAPARDAAAAVYAWCRHCDDAIDLVAAEEQEHALQQLRGELNAVYRGLPQEDPLLAAFQRVVLDTGIPHFYPHELLSGLAMDVAGQHYRSVDELLLYCYRVAGTVGLMMCHVMGVRDNRCLTNAAHLGIAMQLTNIGRDVYEDWQRGRLYLPAELLGPGATAQEGLPAQLPTRQAGIAVGHLLDLADGYYRSADAGLFDLGWRAALAVRVARLVYAAIGDVLWARSLDVLAPRAVVRRSRKLFLVVEALVFTLGQMPLRLRHLKPVASPCRVLRFADVCPTS